MQQIEHTAEPPCGPVERGVALPDPEMDEGPGDTGAVGILGRDRAEEQRQVQRVRPTSWVVIITAVSAVVATSPNSEHPAQSPSVSRDLAGPGLPCCEGVRAIPDAAHIARQTHNDPVLPSCAPGRTSVSDLCHGVIAGRLDVEPVVVDQSPPNVAPTDTNRQRFHEFVPDEPDVENKPMFGRTGRTAATRC